MAGPFQRYIPSGARAAAAAKRKPRKPKDVRVSHGGHKRRTVNAPKAW
jgi:hypothetical protein